MERFYLVHVQGPPVQKYLMKHTTLKLRKEGMYRQYFFPAVSPWIVKLGVVVAFVGVVVVVVLLLVVSILSMFSILDWKIGERCPKGLCIK